MPEIPPQAAQAAGEPAELRDLPKEVRVLVHAVDRMRDRWAEADEAVRLELWQAVHAANDAVWDRLDDEPAGERQGGDAPARGCKAPQSVADPIRRVSGGPHLSSTPPEGLTALRERVAVILARAYHEDILTPDVYAMAGIVLAVRDDTLTEALRRAEQAAVARVRALHCEYRIYDHCGHEAHDDYTAVVDIDAVGAVCQDGYQYSICRECCTSGDAQTEECASGHTPGSCWPCATRRALDVPADGEQPPTPRPAKEIDHG